MKGPARPVPRRHTASACVGRGAGRRSSPSYFSFLFLCSWVMVPSDLRAGRRVARWSGAAPTWAVVKMVGCWLIGTLTPPNSVWGVVFWARGCEFPVNFAGTRGSSLEPALSSVCLSGLSGRGSGSRFSFSFGRSGHVNVGRAVRPRIRYRRAATRFNLHAQRSASDGRVRVNGPPGARPLCGPPQRRVGSRTPGRPGAP